jgi:DNA-binding response OmpR family regulator
LVVDDEASIRLLCRVNLELDGFEVVEAETIPDARARIDAGGIDVALVDVHVGDQDGRKLVRELVARSERPRIALVTGSVQLAPDERAGADEVIEKPFSLDLLIAAVRRLAGIDSAST